MKHILRYGTHADQKYFGDGFEDCYNMIAINANMVAFSPNALALFVGKLTVDKAFFIDPITHLFQHSQSFISNNEGVIKKSIENLIEKYSVELIETSEYKSSQEATQERYDFMKSELRADQIDEAFALQFTRNVLDYQKNVAWQKGNIEQYNKYIEFAKEREPSLSGLEIHQEPDFLVAPYFFIGEEDEWVEKNIRFIEIAKSIEAKKDIFAQIVISKTIIERSLFNPGESSLEGIIDRYNEVGVDGFLFWIDAYFEQKELAESLKQYISSLRILKRRDKPIYILYGSYFSALLSNGDDKIVDGVAHGLEYGEAREVVPLGGGIPMAKFYFYPLHKRMSVKDMSEVIRALEINTKEEFFEKICSCSMCKELIKTNNVLTDFQLGYGQTKPSTFQRGGNLVTVNFPTIETKGNSLRHYLYNKKIEFLSTTNKSLKSLIREMEVSLLTYEGIVDSSELGHLKEWIRAVNESRVAKSR